VAALCTQTFSLGPKYPPPAHDGRAFDRGLRMAKPKMDPKRDAPTAGSRQLSMRKEILEWYLHVHPVFRPR